MNKRTFIKGIVASAVAGMVPAVALGGGRERVTAMPLPLKPHLNQRIVRGVRITHDYRIDFDQTIIRADVLGKAKQYYAQVLVPDGSSKSDIRYLETYLVEEIHDKFDVKGDYML